MVAPVLSPEKERIVLEELLWPETADGSQPEQRIVVFGVSWERYLAFDKELGDDRPSPRLYYLEGELEIAMTTSNEHERIKEWIGSFVEDFLLEKGIETATRGQATMRLVKQAGAEPDKSWCISGEKEFPDLVLEIALTSGGLKKLDVYQHFRVPEVWFWRRNKLEIFTLGKSGRYETSRKSRLLPGLNIALLERCVGISSWHQARQTFRAGLAKRR